MNKFDENNINMDNIEKGIKEIEVITKSVQDTVKEIGDLLKAKDMIYFVAASKAVTDENHNFMTVGVNMPYSHMHEMLRNLFLKLNFDELSHIYSILVEILKEITPRKEDDNG